MDSAPFSRIIGILIGRGEGSETLLRFITLPFGYFVPDFRNGVVSLGGNRRYWDLLRTCDHLIGNSPCIWRYTLGKGGDDEEQKFNPFPHLPLVIWKGIVKRIRIHRYVTNTPSNIEERGFNKSRKTWFYLGGRCLTIYTQCILLRLT